MSTPPDPFTALLSHLAHEMRTPLSVAQGYARMLESGRYGDLTSDQARAVSATARCCQQLSGLADQLSLLGKIERGEIALAGGGGTAPVPLDPLLAALAAAHTPLVDHPVHVSHTPSASPDGPAVRSDATLLRRALATLIEAVVRTAPDDSTVVLTTDARPGAGGMLAVAIAPAARVDALFAAADEALAPLNDFEPGLGLGLAIARRVIAAGGGRAGAHRVDGVLAVRLLFPLAS